ncbi:cytochrome P450 [Kitasatospora paracochleata]|uniref:Cytochrome P450 n=1 Tax=Kitasatospora paracochleata TaxID=58354 RepID=A0ABT1IZY5_9ACTN|nr:cytochrome P450 [Kitasatospora paracochleata]MCP2310702.1 cytochrome P450 [Kitasatospora paracochleata]
MDGTAIIEQLMTPEGRDDPYPLYREARAMGPVVPCGESLLLVTGYREVHRTLRLTGFGVPEAEQREQWDEGWSRHRSRVLLSRSMLERNAPDHGRARSLIASVFTARRVAALEPAVTAAVHRLLDGMAEAGADGSPVDFMDAFAFRLPVGVICELLGVPEADRHRFRPYAADLTAALELITTAAELAAADEAADELSGYFAELAARRRAHPEDDLVSALVQVAADDRDRLSGQELLANLVLLLVAGFETTTNLLGNGLARLFDHPEVRTGLRAGTITAAGFTEEVLRHDSPVQLTSRTALTDGLEIGSIPTPYGTGAFLLLGAANRDPDRYREPDRFDPTRVDSQPLSFGGGPHYCLGAQLARLESQTAVPALLDRFPGIAPAGRPVRHDRLVLRGYRTLPVTLGPA